MFYILDWLTAVIPPELLSLSIPRPSAPLDSEFAISLNTAAKISSTGNSGPFVNLDMGLDVDREDGNTDEGKESVEGAVVR